MVLEAMRQDAHVFGCRIVGQVGLICDLVRVLAPVHAARHRANQKGAWPTCPLVPRMSCTDHMQGTKRDRRINWKLGKLISVRLFQFGTSLSSVLR